MKENPSHESITQAKYIGDFILHPYRFENLDEVLATFKTKEFSLFNDKEKTEYIGAALLQLIWNAPENSFLLIAIVEFIDRINREKIIANYNYAISNFELWLNQFSRLSNDENRFIRAKIIGKWIPRDEYQIYFPVGMGKVFPGSHYVTAHSSPDLDTTVASFWGWVDAFGARISEGQHIWNVPGGAPPSSIEIAILFYQIFGQNAFKHLAKTRTTLALSSVDLMNQINLIKQKTDQSSAQIDHERAQKAIILVDNQGFFLGDWRIFDVEGVRQVIMMFNNCLRCVENNIHAKTISLFAKKDLSLKDLPKFIHEICEMKVWECEPSKEFTDKQKQHIEGYLIKVLKVKKGLEVTFAEFSSDMKNLSVSDFQECIDHIKYLDQSSLFDASGKLIEDRPKIFDRLEKIIGILDKAIIHLRTYTERLDVALDIKTNVFGYLPHVVSYRADVDELRSKMGTYPYLTVTSSDEEGRMVPLGIVRASELFKPILGTVTLRDFCNRDETKIPSYLEIISVIDHHKSTLQTSSVSVAYVSDAQSSNTLVASLSFSLNDKYSTGGKTVEEIENQIHQLQKTALDSSNKRILQRLLQRYGAALQCKKHTKHYFVSPLREFIEYLHFLYAILDDTDLLSKVSRKDVECVAELLNRLKSLMLKEEVEIIHFDDLQIDDSFVEKAARRILQHPDMYSLYLKIYLAKEQLVEENLLLASQGQSSSIFVDTKIQNGCARVGQTKMFAKNFSSFEKHTVELRRQWLLETQEFYDDHKEIDLHLQMISTIFGAEDVYSGTKKEYAHKDELWIWIPMTEQSIEHLKVFLNNFRSSSSIEKFQQELQVEFLGENAKEYRRIFKESFNSSMPKPSKENLEGESLAILRFRAGSVNSRKEMVTPYLPKVIS